jgi:hypothetical protein
MDLAVIQAKVKTGHYFLSQHAIEEANAEDLDLDQIETTILNGEILEQYADIGRGPGCLIGETIHNAFPDRGYKPHGEQP